MEITKLISVTVQKIMDILRKKQKYLMTPIWTSNLQIRYRLGTMQFTSFQYNAVKYETIVFNTYFVLNEFYTERTTKKKNFAHIDRYIP